MQGIVCREPEGCDPCSVVVPMPYARGTMPVSHVPLTADEAHRIRRAATRERRTTPQFLLFHALLAADQYREPPCTCVGPARDAHDRECPVRIANPRVDLGDPARGER